MTLLEDIFVSVAVLVISGASALALGHLFLSVVVKDRRSSYESFLSLNTVPDVVPSPVTSSPGRKPGA
jgi:hypothetical protein